MTAGRLMMASQWVNWLVENGHRIGGSLFSGFNKTLKIYIDHK